MEEFSLLLKSHSEEKARQLIQERYSLTGSQKPFLVLHEGASDKSSTASIKKKKTKHVRRSKKKSMLSQQLQAFLATGDKDYKSYEPIHELWKGYITTTLASNNGPAALQTILSADWHGALIYVKTCKNPSMVGMNGILLWESRSQWWVVTSPEGIKQVPKRGSVIEIICPNDDRYAVVGDRVLCRSSERTTRKFKPHDVSGVTPLLLNTLMK